jgi:GNAT superfamily N-acetyltransferase
MDSMEFQMDKFAVIPPSQWSYVKALAGHHLSLSEQAVDKLGRTYPTLICGCYVGEQLAGICLGLPSDTELVVELAGPYLMDEYRRQGRGGKLLTFFEEQAGRAGFFRARAMIRQEQSFWRNNGYHLTGDCLAEKSIQGVLHYSFARDAWSPNDFIYAASAKYDYRMPFDQREDCIANQMHGDDFAYISMLTRQRFSGSLHVASQLSFDHYGAPLIVITDDLSPQDTGKFQVGRHWEVVAYEGGINVWELSLVHGNVVPCKLAHARFTVPSGQPLLLEVAVDDHSLTVSLEGHRLTAEGVDLPDFFHVGITACEGINRFWSLDIDRI